MSTWEERSLVEDLVARGEDDWVSVAEVFDVASRTGLTRPETLRALSMGLITEVLIRDLMVPGDVTDAGFQQWTCSTQEAIARIAEEWFLRAQPVVLPGEIAWLDTTQPGSELAESVLAREQA